MLTVAYSLPCPGTKIAAVGAKSYFSAGIASASGTISPSKSLSIPSKLFAGSIIVPGAFTSGTNHFAHAGAPADKARQAEYDNGPYAHLGDDIMKGFAATAPADADVADVAKAIVNVVDMPFGKRPFRVHIDPAQDGAEIVNGVADRVRTEMYRNIGLSGSADSSCLFALILNQVERSSVVTLSTGFSFCREV